eukprot:scaffold280950_cov30-Tisochrysis_lutea.AAC.4
MDGSALRVVCLIVNKLSAEPVLVTASWQLAHRGAPRQLNVIPKATETSALILHNVAADGAAMISEHVEKLARYARRDRHMA